MGHYLVIADLRRNALSPWRRPDVGFASWASGAILASSNLVTTAKDRSMRQQERRIRHGWTHEQLAEHAGLSVRTIQRLESGAPATLETPKCLAAVFETTVSTLVEEQNMTPVEAAEPSPAPDLREKEAIEYVQMLKGFITHGVIFAVMMPMLIGLNILVSPNEWWFVYVLVAWLGALALHGVFMFVMYGPLGPAWEQRQFRKRMDQGG